MLLKTPLLITKEVPPQIKQNNPTKKILFRISIENSTLYNEKITQKNNVPKHKIFIFINIHLYSKPYFLWIWTISFYEIKENVS